MSSRNPTLAVRRFWRQKRCLRYLLLLLAAIWCLAAAQDPSLEQLLSWEHFLTWLTTPSGVSLGAGVLLSIFFEYIPHYDKLSKKLKRVIFAAACVFVPVLGASLGVLTLAWSPGWIPTFWPAIVTGVFTFGTGTLAHTPKLKDAPEPVPVELMPADPRMWVNFEEEAPESPPEE